MYIIFNNQIAVMSTGALISWVAESESEEWFPFGKGRQRASGRRASEQSVVEEKSQIQLEKQHSAKEANEKSEKKEEKVKKVSLYIVFFIQGLFQYKFVDNLRMP